MPEFVRGLPLHPLVIHFVVALLVIAVLGAVLTAVWPAVRRRYGWLAFAAALVATLLVPVATDSGEKLASRLPANDLITEHQRLGDMMVWWAVGLTVAVGALMVVHTMAARKTTTKVAVGAAGAEQEETTVQEAKPQASALVLMIVLAVVTVGVAVGTGVHVFRVGDAGARAVWEGVENLPVQNG